ncbi:GNAT family N-acetyltransferase [Aureimonas sp. AU20]|uniref:GNAT family N-acetyltransferase n=1 Tax=Aureimonas sp. AU20 TaxID=1349819 RepID=UPI0007220E41|nr:GNAT family N-acetyltransferase [Aureimonas sp. AU20]ALN74457.1 hypothetical protein M673_17140 [Aureimonas sp. AU20]
MSDVVIRPVDASPRSLNDLSDLMIETVANGGSVSFLHPLDEGRAKTFWTGALAAAASGERVVLGAFDGERIVGTVTVFLALPQNQPHRGEIGKLMTAVSHRGRGIASTLMAAAEALARERGKSLLVLDTAEEEGAASLYERLGYIRAGLIPHYAFKPQGGLTGTVLFWKQIAPLPDHA